MINYNFPAKLKELYDKAVKAYASGTRSASGLYDKAEVEWLATNGITPQHMYDYAEDENSAASPDSATPSRSSRRATTTS
jgi:hypothetical protein